MANIRQIERVQIELWKDGRFIFLATFSLPMMASRRLCLSSLMLTLDTTVLPW